MAPQNNLNFAASKLEGCHFIQLKSKYIQPFGSLKAEVTHISFFLCDIWIYLFCWYLAQHQFQAVIPSQHRNLPVWGGDIFKTHQKKIQIWKTGANRKLQGPGVQIIKNILMCPAKWRLQTKSLAWHGKDSLAAYCRNEGDFTDVSALRQGSTCSRLWELSFCKFQVKREKLFPLL